ncbi:MAG: hypothetical protein LBR43_01110 [Spiroplasmataceae bacterium]|nr:hypothetical protein [Spiroplasmataceae bacterium]
MQALAEFQQKQNTLSSGVLVLINDQIHHFLTKKDWESRREELLNQKRNCFKLVNLEVWHKIKN